VSVLEVDLLQAVPGGSDGGNGSLAEGGHMVVSFVQ
jgi:hypothetical protein